MTQNLTINCLAFLGSLGWPEMIILGVLGVLIFGKRLPQVGKSVGQSIVEFKKGLSGVKDEFDDAVKSTKQLDDPATQPPSKLNTSENAPEASTSPPQSL